MEREEKDTTKVDIQEKFPDEQLLYAETIPATPATLEEIVIALTEYFQTTQPASIAPQYADFVNYLVSGVIPYNLNSQGQKRFKHEAQKYFWDDPLLFKQCVDQVIRRCVREEEQQEVL